MSLFTKSKLRVIAGISFLLALIVGWFGAQQSMIRYGPPEMINNNQVGAGKIMIAALVLLLIPIVSLTVSFFRKE